MILFVFIFSCFLLVVLGRFGERAGLRDYQRPRGTRDPLWGKLPEGADSSRRLFSGTAPAGYEAMFSANAIFASLIWGAIGTGYLVFGRKQRSLIPALG